MICSMQDSLCSQCCFAMGQTIGRAATRATRCNDLLMPTALCGMTRRFAIIPAPQLGRSAHLQYRQHCKNTVLVSESTPLDVGVCCAPDNNVVRCMPSAIYELIVLPQATQGEEPGVRTPVAHCSSAPPDRDANRHASTMLKNIMMSNEASCRSRAGGARGVATASLRHGRSVQHAAAGQHAARSCVRVPKPWHGRLQTDWPHLRHHACTRDSCGWYLPGTRRHGLT